MGDGEKIKRILEIILSLCISATLGVCCLLYLLYKRIKYGSEIFKEHPRNTPPSILQDAKWGTHHYIHLKKQGIKLHYVEKGDRNAPMLLCLHGFPEAWFSWRHQLAEFGSDFWVVAVDLRGYGDSDKPPNVSDYDATTIIEDIREFVQELEHSNCTLVAHDWGGPIAWSLIAKYPELFKRHISINAPHPGTFREVLRGNWTQLCKSWYVFFFQNRFLPEMVVKLNDFQILVDLFRGPKDLREAYPDDVVEAYKYLAQKSENLTYPINWYRQNLSRPPLPETNLKVIVPTLIIWGLEDIALCPEIPKKMTEVCTDVQLRMIEGASHFVHEEEPKHVNEIIRNYLQITAQG